MRYSLVCEGQIWTGWQSFSVRQSMESAAHSFTFTTTDQYQDGLDRWNVRGGSKIEFFIDDIRIVSGFVRKYSVSISDTAHTVSIDGDSAAIDIVESAHLGPYFWKAGSAEQIIKAVLSPFGLQISIAKPLKPIPKGGYRVAVTDAPFEIIRKLLERNGLTIFTDRNGQIVATDGKDAIDAGSIGRGDYTAISADHDLTNSYSQIIVKSQKNQRVAETKSGFDAAQKVKKVIINPAETRYRPAIFVNSGEPDAQKELAEDIRKRFTGDVITAGATVKSHLNKKGDVWGVNQLVFLDEPYVYAKQKLVTSEVEFSLSQDQGFTTNLSLKLPVTFHQKGVTARDARTGTPGPFRDISLTFTGEI